MSKLKMGLSKETLIDLQEKYEKVRKLIDEDSKNDPENQPYTSKYSARTILTVMKNGLNKLLDENIPNTLEHHHLTGLLSIVWLNLGTISIETEELSTGEEQLMNCLRCIENNECHPDYILIALCALNQLGILWSERENTEKSKEFLERAEKLYVDFRKTEQIPIDMTELFKAVIDNVKTDANEVLEKTYTLTLYYLAQIYSAMKEEIKSSIYFHITLKRQLETKDYEPIEWALNSATLSQFFMEKNGFKQARHHLAAASFILNQYEDDLQQVEETEETMLAKKERLKHRSADVARCWAKYGLLLLNVSRERLMSDTDCESGSDSVSMLSSDLAGLQLNSVTNTDISQMFFPLELSVYENQIIDTFVLTFDDAKEVFLNIQTWLNKAKDYYTLENHASDHVAIVQDISQSYKALIFFEDDEERQCKMLKRRIDCLEPVVKELNPSYYLLVCRQMWYELAEIFGDMLEIKYDKLQNSHSVPTAHALKKINMLVENSILYFNRFLNSIKDSNNTIPENISEDLVKPMLVAYFHIARLYGKMITPDKKQQLINCKKSLEAYTALVDYCERKESAAQMMNTELGVCKSMAQLLPFKIEKLRNAVGDNSEE